MNQPISNWRSPHHHHHIEFPTSPVVQEEGHEMFHATHPQHPISQAHFTDLFVCAACKEFGAGLRFACTHCDYQLHHFCALAPPALKRHPIHPFHKIILFYKPVKGGILKSGCDICVKPIKGSVFKCSVCRFQMHPCCAMLSTELFNKSVHPHTLRLLPMHADGQSSSADSAGFVCGECHCRSSGRVYHCTICDYHLHAVCAKNTVNGVQANGFKGVEKVSKIGTAARVASQVVMEFIGGLFEGIGEGVGEGLIQSAAKGSRYHISSSPTCGWSGNKSSGIKRFTVLVSAELHYVLCGKRSEKGTRENDEQ
ncbi:uncharacterized protein LOC120197000 [Hibiscus syriacus]|uniref:uncharacterized protein LOC120197000 n=1 Tax=Hibiscus syriacus TaxID=106335 RepID=UPI001924388A|nr:uncharacterized protein LOC120197000 [Hibiscus syriacus]